jgi:hypothetical protein
MDKLPSLRELIGLGIIGMVPAAMGVPLVIWLIYEFFAWFWFGGPAGQLG